MLLEYVKSAMHRAKYELLSDDGTFYGHIPDCRGVWANARTLEECRDELQEVLEDWILIRTRERLDLPIIDDIDLNLRDQQQEVA